MYTVVTQAALVLTLVTISGPAIVQATAPDNDGTGGKSLVSEECATALYSEKILKLYSEDVPNPGLFSTAYMLARGIGDDYQASLLKSELIEAWHRYTLITVGIAAADGLSEAEKEYFVEKMSQTAEVSDDLIERWINEAVAQGDTVTVRLARTFRKTPFILMETVYDALSIAGSDGQLPSKSEVSLMQRVKAAGGIASKPIFRVFQRERNLLSEFQDLFDA